jgi:AcrR family transcriptional regulator
MSMGKDRRSKVGQPFKVTVARDTTFLHNVPVPRVKDQARRRRDFIEAARRRVVEQGLDPVRIRDVAEEAKLSPGLVSYYFADLDELFREVYSDAVDRFHHHRREVLASVDDPRARLKVLVQGGLPSSPEDEMCILLVEFGPLVRRNTVVNALRTTLYERQVSLYESVLQTGAALGVFSLSDSALSVARNIVALEDAYGSHVVSKVSIDRAEAERLILSYAASATGCDLSDV